MPSWSDNIEAVARAITAKRLRHDGISEEELAADVEEGVLDVEKAGTHLVLHRMDEDRTDAAVELVDVAEGLNAGGVLFHPRAVAEAGGPGVASGRQAAS